METKIKEKEAGEMVFELTRDNDGCIKVKVNGKTVVQFVNMGNEMDMYTNFESNYEELSIKKI